MALLYVLANFRKHARVARASGIDPFSSGEWFDGWHEWTPADGRASPWVDRVAWRREGRVLDDDEATACVVVPARSWLARVGWRRWGLIGVGESPANSRVT